MLASDTYKTAANKSQGIYKEKGSKFISLLFPIKSEHEIKPIIEEVKSEHHTAKHVCYAYKLGTNDIKYRTYDAGEPSGTAGKPIYSQILSKELTNTLIVVVRYFGGTLLGTGGLTTAYKQAALDAINNTNILLQTVNDYFRISFNYDNTSHIMLIFNRFEVAIIEQKFGMMCEYLITIRKSSSEKFSNEVASIQKAKMIFIKTD